MNPCSVLLNTKTKGPAREAAAEFAEWLGGEDAQKIVRRFGRDWSYPMPLFTVAEREEFDAHEQLSGRL